MTRPGTREYRSSPPGKEKVFTVRVLGIVSLIPGDLAGSLDQWGEGAQGFGYCKEWMMQELRRVGPFFSVHFESLGEVVAECR